MYEMKINFYYYNFDCLKIIIYFISYLAEIFISKHL